LIFLRKGRGNDRYSQQSKKRLEHVGWSFRVDMENVKITDALLSTTTGVLRDKIQGIFGLSDG
jgi:hypothetical protein